MAAKKSVAFLTKQDTYSWYEKLDAWFASADEVPIRQLESKVVYSYHSNTSLSSYIRNIDVAFDRSYRCTERNVFYASIFLILAGDDKERTVLTRQSVSRAFDAFQINNRSIFNTFIYELLEDKDSVIRCFYGFLTEEESRNLLETEGQWLLRMDKQGFIITEATGINEDGTTSVTNYRLTYECGNFYLGSTVFAKLSHITELFPMELAHCSSPYFAICHGGHPSYYAHGDSSDRGYVWGKLISCINDDKSDYAYFRCMLWALKVLKPTDPIGYVQRCASSACSYGTIEETIQILKQCLQLGASMNARVGSFRSINESISTSGNLSGNFEELRKFLWSNGFDPNARVVTTPIFWCAAANTNWGKKVVTLWTSHPDLDINISDRNGGHVLHWCTDKIPRSVLEHPKLDINALNSQGESILYTAIRDNYPFEKIVQFIHRGVDAKKKLSRNKTYLQMWIERNEKEANVDKIWPAVRIFLQYGIDINEINDDGFTALHIAAQNATLEIVKILVENGAKVDGHPDSETTPLHLAAERGDADIVQYLLEHRADTTKRNSAGQLPKDVAALSAKELFEQGTSLPQLNFMCKYLPVAISPKHTLPFPRCNAQCFFIGEYVYIWGGVSCFNDWWDEYGYVTLEHMNQRVGSCWRAKISNVPLVWENIQMHKEISNTYSETVTCAPVDGNLWFHAQDSFAIFNTTKKESRWSHTPSTVSNSVYKLRYFFDFGDRLIYPLLDSMTIYDKMKHGYGSLSINQGDLPIKNLVHSQFMVLLNDAFWVKEGQSIYTISLEKKRWRKSTTISNEYRFLSSIIGFGDRFLLALVLDASQKCKLFVLDIDTGLFNYQDIEFDYSNFFENDVSKYEKLNERTLQEWRKHEPQQYETARAAVLQQISEKNFPYRDATLAVTGSTLAIFGGNHESIWSCSDILTLDLSPLLPYLSLEQLAGIAASKNCANYSIGEMKRVATAIRSKFNLY
jgi:hypothetical protein